MVFPIFIVIKELYVYLQRFYLQKSHPKRNQLDCYASHSDILTTQLHNMIISVDRVS